MNPLCVSWAPAIYTQIGWDNMKKFAKLFDTIIYIPNRVIHSKLTRIAFEEFGDPFQPWHYGQQGYPLKVAIKYKIPFIMYGENQGIKEDIKVVPIPGVSSITAAMSASGFKDQFLFYGFLPKKKMN